MRGLFEFCENLLAKGASPDVELNAGECLCSAAKHQKMDLVENLVAAGVDVNAQDSRKNTALQWAVLVRDVELCRMLFKSGADPNIASEDGHTCLTGS